VSANEPPFGGGDEPVAEDPRNLKTPIRKRLPERPQEAENFVAPTQRRPPSNELRVLAPGIGVRAPPIERVDVPLNNLLHVGQRAVPPAAFQAPILAPKHPQC
jgi:hypothetical protein